nr:MAG TPA: hypothetical protein [Caudoviricetes sp.]
MWLYTVALATLSLPFVFIFIAPYAMKTFLKYTTMASALRSYLKTNIYLSG